MSELDQVFAGSIPEIYERLLVPLIFQDAAVHLAGVVASAAPVAMLESAAGTGVLTRALLDVLDASARVTATDLNQPMLDHAATTTDDDRVEWRQADALALPFDDETFDVVACQFGVMFFPDRIAGYRESLRVLKPGGRFVFNVWDRIETNVFAEEVDIALQSVFPDDPPRFLARTPHGYHDLDLIGIDLAAAGFASVTSATVDGISAASSAQDVAVAYCQGTPLRNEIEARDPSRLGPATAAAADALARRFGTGPVRGPVRSHAVTARR